MRKTSALVGLALLGCLLLAAGRQDSTPTAPPPAAATPSVPADLLYPGEEKFLAHVRQLTFGGQNAEAYWSLDGTRIIFQSNEDRLPCDQIYTMNADGSQRRRVSNGLGKTTCAFWFPSGDRILYASTFGAGPDCPPLPDRSRGYVWSLDDYDLYTARADGSQIRKLFGSRAYDAEATISKDGKKIVFTSARDGDLEIYSCNADGTGVTRLTHTPGYDGGPFYSDDGAKIVYRADHPGTPDELAAYRENLARGTYAPRALEIRVMNADGTRDHAVTSNGAANFAPYFFPDGKRIIFSSNLADPRRRDFDLFVIQADGSALTRVTYSPEFDGFPMFDRGGRRLIFASNRNSKKPRETNIFVADWVGK
jgi:Tol biopolymer transport system component